MFLEGKTALATGGLSAIGLAVARRLRDRGTRLAITGRSRETPHCVAAELGDDVLAIQADVTSLDELKPMKSQLHDAFGSLDILFTNAGIALGAQVPMGRMGRPEEIAAAVLFIAATHPTTRWERKW